MCGFFILILTDRLASRNAVAIHVAKSNDRVLSASMASLSAISLFRLLLNLMATYDNRHFHTYFSD